MTSKDLIVFASHGQQMQCVSMSPTANDAVLAFGARNGWTVVDDSFETGALGPATRRH